MAKKSAGILVYRRANDEPEVLLVHPGGPYFVNKDLGVWSVPKGEITEKEDTLDAAKREFNEETGLTPEGTFIELSPVKLKSGKIVYAWAIEHNLDLTHFTSNTFNMEWPPRSGKFRDFPETDKAAWFSIPIAKEKINNGQLPFIDELIKMLSSE